MRKVLLVLCLFLIVSTAVGQVVSIPDRNLRAKIEEALGKASGATITVDDMAGLTWLNAQNANISDLTGLEHAPNLTRLNIGAEWTGEGLVNSNSVSDISAVSGLTNLRTLQLDNNGIIDISAVSGLTNLVGLGLGYNGIIDISAVSGLTNLWTLVLANNGIIDISAVSGLTNLGRLYLSGNSIIDISALVSNTGFWSGDEVHVTGNPLSATAHSTHIPTLQGRGVDITFDAHDAGIARLDINGDDVVMLTPKETALLPNYPNPFNPETWIPYHLAHDADVSLTIYDIDGVVVRQLDLGHWSAGYYTDRAKAAYWDGRNGWGESVASGVYFYQFSAGDYSAMRKLVILK